MTDSIPILIPSTTDYLRDLAARIATPSDGIRLMSVVEVLEAMDEQARGLGRLPLDWRERLAGMPDITNNYGADGSGGW